MITTLLAFVFTLGVLVTIHEYGHYRVAVACGVKVLRFSVGFGRVLWRRQKSADGTEFVISALPLGGYVRMLDEREGPVEPAERHLAFNRKPLWQRACIVAAGPAANLLLAVMLYAGAHWLGVEEPKAVLGAPPAGSLAQRAGLQGGELVNAVSDGAGGEWTDVKSLADLDERVMRAMLQGEPMSLMVSDAAGRNSRTVMLALDTVTPREPSPEALRRIGVGEPFREPVLRDVKAGGPADQAGLRSGDRVISIDGTPITDAALLFERIRASGSGADPRAMEFRVDRAGRIVEAEVTPKVVDDKGQRIGRIETAIGGPVPMVKVRYGLIEGLTHAVGRTWDMSSLTLRMLGKMVIGEASLKNLSGPLTIADYAGQSARLGLAYYLGFLAVVSISLGVLNLLPLPMLDGGHLTYYLFEAVTGRPVTELWLERLQRGGVAIMLLMMSLALYNDVARLVGPH